MGERLVIKIVANDKVEHYDRPLLSGYWHWSGFTPSMRAVLEKMYETPEVKPRKDCRPYKLIQEFAERMAQTGAGFSYEGKDKANPIYALFYLANLPKSKSRDDGIMDILPEEIEDAVRWADETVVIHADEGWLDLQDAFFKVNFEGVLEQKGIEVSDMDSLDEVSRAALNQVWQEHVKEAVNCPFNIRHLAEKDVVNFCKWIKGASLAKGNSFIFSSGDGYYQTIY